MCESNQECRNCKCVKNGENLRTFLQKIIFYLIQSVMDCKCGLENTNKRIFNRIIGGDKITQVSITSHSLMFVKDNHMTDEQVPLAGEGVE